MSMDILLTKQKGDIEIEIQGYSTEIKLTPSVDQIEIELNESQICKENENQTSKKQNLHEVVQDLGQEKVKRERKQTNKFTQEIQLKKTKQPKKQVVLDKVENQEQEDKVVTPKKLKKVKTEETYIVIDEQLNKDQVKTIQPNLISKVEVLDEEVKIWKDRVPQFEHLYNQIVEMGVPKLCYSIQTDQLDSVLSQIKEQLNLPKEEQNFQLISKLIQQTLANQIEDESTEKLDSVLAQQCQEYLGSYLIQIPSLDLQELIVSMKEKKYYLPKQIKTLEFQLRNQFRLNDLLMLLNREQIIQAYESEVSRHHVQEVQSKDVMVLYCKGIEFQNNRKIRLFIKRLLDSLHRLMDIIKRTRYKFIFEYLSKKENIPKIEDVHKSYLNAKEQPLKLLQEKIPKQIEKSGMKIQTDAIQLETDLLCEAPVCEGGQIKKAKLKKKKKNIQQENQQQKITPNKVEKSTKLDSSQKKITDMKLHFTPVVLSDRKQSVQKEQILLNHQVEVVLENEGMCQELPLEINTFDQSSRIQVEQKDGKIIPTKKKESLLTFFQHKVQRKALEKSKQVDLIHQEFFKSFDSIKDYSQWDKYREDSFELLLENLSNGVGGLVGLTINDLIQPKQEIKMDEEMEISYDKNASKKKIKPRKVHLYIQDSLKILRGIKFFKTSKRINGKKPLRQDDDVIDYELETEDEMQELQAESITKSQKDDGEEINDSLSESDDRFVVPDGYLSEAEVSDKEEFKLRGGIIQVQEVEENQTNYYTFLLKEQQLKDDIGMFQDCTIQKIEEETEFPLRVKKVDDMKTSTFFDDQDNQRLFINYVHGSYQSIKSIVTQFRELNQCGSKNALERRLKEIADKKKTENQTKERWIVKAEVFSQVGLQEPDVLKLLQEKEAEYQLRRKLKKEADIINNPPQTNAIENNKQMEIEDQCRIEKYIKIIPQQEQK